MPEHKRKSKQNEKYYRIRHDGEYLYFIIAENRILCYWEKYEKKWYVYPYDSLKVDRVISVFLSAKELTREHMLYMGFLEE